MGGGHFFSSYLLIPVLIFLNFRVTSALDSKSKSELSETVDPTTEAWEDPGELSNKVARNLVGA